MSAFGERRGWRGREADTGAMTPRSAYSAKKRRAETLTMDLMMNLDAHTIASIKKEFVENGGEVDIYEFVRIMRTYLPEHLEVRKAGAGDADDAEDGKSSGDADRGGGGASRTGGGWRASTRRLNEGAAAAQSAADEAGMARQQRQRSVSEMQLVANLCELFKEIDVNGDAMMEWDEFTSFIVDKAVVFRDDASVDAIAGYHPAHLPPVVEERSKRMAVAKAVRGGTKKRAPQFHNEVIENVKFIPRLNQLAVLEQRSPVVKMYNARTMGLAGTLKGHDGIPEAVEYLETPSSYLISSCADSTMALWDLEPGNKQYSYITCWPTPHVQMSLAWSSQYTTLYSGSTTGLVHSWDIKAREETSCMAGHSDIVMDVIVIKQLDNVASASLDSTICMWDMCSGAQRQCLKGHSKGVLSLAYSPDFRFLISSGFDHEALVWSPFVPSLLYKLKGHSTPLLGVRAVPNKPEVITASVDGQFKVWDLRSFKCVQTFSDENAMVQNVAAFDHCPPLRRIVSATKKLSAFDQGGERQLTKVSDELPITVALFNTTSMTILTASARTVKIWNALTGTLLRVYRDVAESDITSVCLDDRQRKFIAGEANGSVRVYNYANGAVMKSMVSHTREVSKLLYCNELKVVVSCSWDRSIVVHDEMDPEKGVVLRMMDHLRSHQADVSCADWNHTVSLVATGSSDKTVRVWDLETGKLEALLPHPAEVVAVQFLSPLPFLVSADSSGNVFLWGVRGSNCKHVLAAAWSLNPTGFWPARLASAQAAQAEVDAEEAQKAAVRAELEAKLADEAKRARRARLGSTAAPTKGLSASEQKAAEARAAAAEEEESKAKAAAAAAASVPVATPRVAGAHPTPGSRQAQELESQRHTFEASYAACLAWDPSCELVYTGDERGQLSAWDLSRVLAVINDEAVKPGNVRCRADVDGRAADSTMSALYNGPELVTLEWINRGHKDAIASVQVVSDPKCLLTASYDRCVYCWTTEGAKLGLLCRSVRAGRNPYWNLGVDVAAREAVEDENTGATLDVLAKRAAERRGTQDKSERRAKAAAQARARERAAGGKHLKVGTGFWAAEAEKSRHRTRQRKDRGDGAGEGDMDARTPLAGRSTHSLISDGRSGFAGSEDGTPRGARQRRPRPGPTPLRPALLAKVKPKASPLEATRAKWAGTEMASRETQARVANALHSMSSNMVGRGGRLPKGGRDTPKHGVLTRVPNVADSEILESLTDTYRGDGGSARRGGYRRAGAGAGAGAGSERGGRGRPTVSTELRNAGAASLRSSPSSAQSSARSVSMFNSKTIEAAARLGAILSDLG